MYVCVCVCVRVCVNIYTYLYAYKPVRIRNRPYITKFIHMQVRVNVWATYEYIWIIKNPCLSLRFEVFCKILLHNNFAHVHTCL